MNEDGAVLRKVSPDGNGNARYSFFCPGCECVHIIQTPPWTCNNDRHKPTITPSIASHEDIKKEGTNEIIRTIVCHSYVTDGRIQFLSDSTHKLSGQTVDLKPF